MKLVGAAHSFGLGAYGVLRRLPAGRVQPSVVRWCVRGGLQVGGELVRKRTIDAHVVDARGVDMLDLRFDGGVVVAIEASSTKYFN